MDAYFERWSESVFDGLLEGTEELLLDVVGGVLAVPHLPQDHA